MKRKSNINKNNRSMRQEKKNAVTICTLLFFTLFPLIVNNYYFNITVTKYYTYCILSVGIIFAACYYDSEMWGQKKRRDSLWVTLKGCDKMDLMMAGFCLSAVVSWLFSPWRVKAFTGSETKYVGLLFLLLAVGIYYGITKYLIWHVWIERAFSIILILVSIMAVIQFCGYDIFGFYKNMAAGTNVMYIATFGHVDVFSAFLSVYLPVCMYLFCYAETRRESWLFGGGVFAGMFSVFSANSDSSYIGFMVALCVLLILTFSKACDLKRFGYMMLLFLFSMIGWKILEKIFAGQMRKSSFMTEMFCSTKGIIVAAVFTGIIFGASFWMEKYRDGKSEYGSVTVLSIVLTAIAVLLLAFFWFSVLDRKTDLGELEQYLRFSDHWGSDRGYVWKWLGIFFAVAPFWTKLFGTGPDTTGFVLKQYFHEEMSEELGVYYASAHNEYLNYLVTIGIAGTFFYLALLVGSVVKCMKKRNEVRYLGAVGTAILAYSAMAVVNISQPITMPFIFLLIAIANQKKDAACKK